jgi:hypothetical protein
MTTVCQRDIHVIPTCLNMIDRVLMLPIQSSKYLFQPIEADEISYHSSDEDDEMQMIALHCQNEDLSNPQDFQNGTFLHSCFTYDEFNGYRDWAHFQFQDGDGDDTFESDSFSVDMSVLEDDEATEMNTFDPKVFDWYSYPPQCTSKQIQDSFGTDSLHEGQKTHDVISLTRTSPTSVIGSSNSRIDDEEIFETSLA